MAKLSVADVLKLNVKELETRFQSFVQERVKESASVNEIRLLLGAFTIQYMKYWERKEGMEKALAKCSELKWLEVSKDKGMLALYAKILYLTQFGLPVLEIGGMRQFRKFATLIKINSNGTLEFKKPKFEKTCGKLKAGELSHKETDGKDTIVVKTELHHLADDKLFNDLFGKKNKDKSIKWNFKVLEGMKRANAVDSIASWLRDMQKADAKNETDFVSLLKTAVDKVCIPIVEPSTVEQEQTELATV